MKKLQNFAFLNLNVLASGNFKNPSIKNRECMENMCEDKISVSAFGGVRKHQGMRCPGTQ